MNKIQTLKRSPFLSKTQELLQRLYYTPPSRNGTLDYGAYGLLIKHFSDQNLPNQAKQLHARIILSHVTPQSFLASQLLSFYSKTNKLAHARYVFDEIPHKTIFSLNSLLIAYTCNNMLAHAIDLFSSWVWRFYKGPEDRPDNYTISCVLKAFSGSLCDLRLAKEVHCFVFRGGLVRDVFVVNALITYYSNCDGASLARKVFDEMGVKDIVSWNSMLAGYSQGGFYQECKAMFREMMGSSCLRPNEATIASVLQACGQSNDLKMGIEVHQCIYETQVKLDILGHNALIGMYAKCGSLDYARELFLKMSEKDEVTYAAIITGYMFHGFVDKAMDLFHEIKLPGLSTWNAMISGLFQNNQYEGILNFVRDMQSCGLRANAVTLTSILPTFSFFSNLKGGKEVHAYAVRHGYDHNVYVETGLVDAYAKAGFLHGAQWVFSQSKCRRSSIIWTAIIAAYAAHGEATDAFSHFREMLSIGVRPDSVTFTAILSACVHSGLVDQAHMFFDAMFPEYGIQPSLEHYACMVGVLSRAGRLTEAMDIVRKFPIEPSAKVWGALLSGASAAGDVELGKFICDHLFVLEPENTGNYVIMSNLYSQAGRWEEAKMVREMMREFGLSKIPGSSWIETIKGLKSFVAKDASSEHTEEIYEILKGLLGVMKEEGYPLQEEMIESISVQVQLDEI